ncbi:MAG: sugar ABC transporter ATP-binding protein [Acidobacteria bacterium]|nr:sugar ABC transporter ATP-binding protein [Acidobacteriota bacterium]
MSLLSAAGVSKSYGSVRVLDGVDFGVDAGQVHVLVGENGAGKSTLIKILGGAVVPDAGVVRLGGRPLEPGDPRAVRRQGLSIVYQEFTLVPEMSVFDNLELGRERGPVLRRAGDVPRVRTVLQDLDLDVDPATRVGDLSVARQQLVEIARGLLTDARALVLDEPTASLSGREVDRLLEVVRRLRARGLGIVYVSHRFEEIFAIADRITVLRDGRVVAVTDAAGASRPQLIRWMVGREVSEEFPPRTASPRETVLDVANLAAPPRFHDVSLCVRAGEIVGLAGLVGAGRTSAALALVGALPARGRVAIGGLAATVGSPADAIAHGIAYVTEDRKARGILPQMSTAANLTLTYLRHFTRAGFLSIAAERAAASSTASRFHVRSAGLDQPAGTLSGGNQQKALLGRFLLLPRRVVVLDEPTRGVDVGARAEIYTLMNQLTTEGLGILMISSDLPELIGMADRVVVMRQGRTVGELARGAATPDAVMAMATGA